MDVKPRLITQQEILATPELKIDPLHIINSAPCMVVD